MRKFHVGLFASVLLVRLGQLLRDDQLGDIHAVAQQVADDFFRVLNGAVRISENVGERRRSLQELIVRLKIRH
jgi:hypothetical protein